jgi:membrane protease YdiL (CAAX protease family)
VNVGARLRVWAAGRHRRFTATMVILISLLVALNTLRIFGPVGTGLVVGPVAALGLVLLARRLGLSWDDLGLSRQTWAKGVAYATGAVLVVAALYAIAAVLPVTRTAFLDARYLMAPGSALLTALVVIPLGTVLLEEIAFRGVLLGLITRHAGVRWGLAFSSVLFGAWHILPSLGLASVNPAVAGVVGAGAGATVVVVLGVVTFTALAGWLLGELRRRSGSLLAAAGLHWAVNGVGVLVATVIYATGQG